MAIACVIVGIPQCWRWNRLPPHDLHSTKENRPLPPGKWRCRAAHKSVHEKPGTAESSTSLLDARGSRITLATIWCNQQSAPSTEVEGGRLLARGRQRQDLLRLGSTAFMRLHCGGNESRSKVWESNKKGSPKAERHEAYFIFLRKTKQVQDKWKVLPSVLITSCVPVQIPLRTTHSPFVDKIHKDYLYQGHISNVTACFHGS